MSSRIVRENERWRWGRVGERGPANSRRARWTRTRRFPMGTRVRRRDGWSSANPIASRDTEHGIVEVVDRRVIVAASDVITTSNACLCLDGLRCFAAACGVVCVRACVALSVRRARGSQLGVQPKKNCAASTAHSHPHARGRRSKSLYRKSRPKMQRRLFRLCGGDIITITPA